MRLLRSVLRAVLRAVLAVSAVFLLAGVVVVATPMTAGAAALQQSAWWYRATTETPVAAPGPPTVTAEQLHVEGTAAGAVAIAGFTYDLAEGESSPVLSVAVATGSAVPPDAVILACRAAIDWTAPATSPGSWDSKPLADCTTSVQGQIADDRASVVFPLQPLVRGRLLDVLIVPGTVAELPAGANGSVFSLTFDRPGAEALSTTPGSPSARGTDEGSSFASDEDFSYEPVAALPPSAVGGPFTVPVPAPVFGDVVAAAAVPVVEPALEPQEQAPSVPRLTRPAAAATPENRGSARKLGFVLLAMGAVAAFALARERQPTTAGEQGVGRLRRPRTGPPPRL